MADPTPTPRVPSLREQQVLDLVALGKSNAEIGRDLFVSEATVKTVVQRVLRKMGARNRAHAVHLGHLRGLIVVEMES